MTNFADRGLVRAMGMTRTFPALTKLALLLALAAHLIAPTASAAPGFDPASMLCAPTGKASPQAEAAIQEMLRLAGVANEDERPAAGHCGACVMTGCAMTAQLSLSLIANSVSEQRTTWAATVHAIPSVHGPPLGLRAPPVKRGDDRIAETRANGSNAPQERRESPPIAYRRI